MFAQIIDFQAEKIKRDARPVATGRVTSDLCNPNLTMYECTIIFGVWHELEPCVQHKQSSSFYIDWIKPFVQKP